MQNRQIARTTEHRIPAKILELLPGPELWRGETAEQYSDMLSAVGIATGATDILDWMMANDVTYLAWEMRRLKSIKAATILDCQIEVIEALLKTTYDFEGEYPDPLYEISDAKNEARRWATDPAFAKMVNERLTERGHDPASILCKAYALCAAELEGYEKAIASREMRRTALMREFSRRDDAKARRLERATTDIIDAEYSDVP